MKYKKEKKLEKKLKGKRLYFINYNFEDKEVAAKFFEELYSRVFGMNVAFIIIYDNDKFDYIDIKIFGERKFIQVTTSIKILPCLQNLRLFNVEQNKQLYRCSIDNFLIEQGINYLMDASEFLLDKLVQKK